jgi:hypothetical protein
MYKTSAYFVVGLGMIAAGHYAVSSYLPGDGDAPDAPPIASLTMASTASVTLHAINFALDAITDAEYAAPAVDMRHPAMIAPLPPMLTVTVLSVDAIYPGIVTFKLPRD